ncbi:MAG TPA: flagellar biosynthesis protein FlhA, partial [Anaeromyxobacteraceae bacterium]|nr:flagellar biosynthesis protein FlhA [Anaeromyxobacteraceae bacterium]
MNAGASHAPARQLAGRARGRLTAAGELAPGLAVVLLVGLLFVPVGPSVVDALVAVSLGISAAVLLATLLAPDALRLSAFPALLLLTTLLRLSIAVASTRLVLSRGEAGRVIEALGRVVMQGSWVAGAVVYAILALVQLLVVSRGAERVAEVAARFTLDALPGKQMAIDAELRAGAIDAAEAGRRRRLLERESQLHGAMDGALKFVKGDAVAGVAIALVNALGGLVAGVMRGMPAGAAARRYVLLAVGDGLASQVPALLLAVAAGIAVTRVAGDDRSVSARVGRELLAEPRALVASGGLLLLLALAPGLPALPFALAGGALAWAGTASARRDRRAPAAEVGAPARGAALSPVDVVAVEVAPELVADGEAGAGWLRDAGEALRRELVQSMGVPAAAVAVRAAPAGPGGWRLLVDGAPAAAGRVPLDRSLCLVPPEDLRLAGIPASPSRHPVTAAPAALVPGDAAGRAAALGPVLGPGERALAEAHAALRRSAHLLVGVQEVQALLDAVEPAAPALVREVSRHVSPGVIAETLRRLLEEEVSIRPLRPILEALLAAPAGAPAPVLCEACRRSLSRHITGPLAAGGALPALLLDPAAELAFRDARHGDGPGLDATRARALLASVRSALDASPRARTLLAPSDVRRPLRDLVAQRFPGLSVLAYE